MGSPPRNTRSLSEKFNRSLDDPNIGERKPPSSHEWGNLIINSKNDQNMLLIIFDASAHNPSAPELPGCAIRVINICISCAVAHFLIPSIINQNHPV
jgi:hypothetical protein